MANSLRVALTGKMKSGKDTAALHLRTKHGGTIFHVAQGVYDVTETLLGYRLFGKKISMENKTKFERLALQYVGRWGRLLFGPDVWLKMALKNLKFLSGNVFITGVRFPNEVMALQDLGVKVIWIDRPEGDRIQAGAFNLTHETETALDGYTGFDGVVYNVGTFESLFIGIDSLVRDWA